MRWANERPETQSGPTPTLLPLATGVADRKLRHPHVASLYLSWERHIARRMRIQSGSLLPGFSRDVFCKDCLRRRTLRSTAPVSEQPLLSGADAIPWIRTLADPKHACRASPPHAHRKLFNSQAAMDDIDRNLLGLLPEDVAMPVAQLADRVGLSPTPVWRRIQKLEQSGVITRRVALLDPEQVGVGLVVYVAIEVRLSRTRGVRPTERELSSNQRDIQNLILFERRAGEYSIPHTHHT